MDTLRPYAPLVLRMGMVAVLAWFGYNQVANPAQWTIWVPEWATGISGLSAATIVAANGWLEIAGAVLLAAGVFVRWVALIMAAHLFVIAFDIGLTAIGVRDLGLAMAMLALALWGGDKWTVDQWRQRRTLDI